MVILNSNSYKGSEWTWVFNGRHKQHKKLIDNPYSNDVVRITESFYVTNFPTYIDAKALWKVCEPYGRIVDAYIATKSSKLGKRFGFVRFMGIENAEEFAKRLTNIWIDSFHLFAAVARFKRRDKPQSRKVTEGTINSRSRVPNPVASKVNHLPTNVSVAKSFASVVHGGELKNSKNQHRGDSRCVMMNDSDLIKVDDSTKVALVKVREVGTMNTVYQICRSEGFTQIKVHHIGGLFQDSATCNAFRNNETMKQVFSIIRSVSQNFVVDERLIWIEISGLPLCAWGSNAYKKVANAVGKFMFFEVDQTSSMGIGRVCIATKQKDMISENVVVTVNGENHMVRVQEIATWSLEIVDDIESEDTSSEKDEEVGDTIEKDESVFVETEEEVDDFEKELKDTEENHIEAEKMIETPHLNNEQDSNVEVEKVKETPHLNNEKEINISRASSDPSRPPGFEAFKRHENIDEHSGETSHTSKCSTMFAKHRKRDVRGISMIHEMSRLIDIGGALGYDVRGCRKTLKGILNEAGVSLWDK